MRARHTGTCKLCYKQWYTDTPIARWLGSYVHKGCKDREARRIASEGQREALPDHLEAIEGWASRKQALRPARGYTRGIKKM